MLRDNVHSVKGYPLVFLGGNSQVGIDFADAEQGAIVKPTRGVEHTEWDSAAWIVDSSSQRVWYQEAQDVVKVLEMAR